MIPFEMKFNFKFDNYISIYLILAYLIISDELLIIIHLKLILPFYFSSFVVEELFEELVSEELSVFLSAESSLLSEEVFTFLFRDLSLLSELSRTFFSMQHFFSRSRRPMNPSKLLHIYNLD